MEKLVRDNMPWIHTEGHKVMSWRNANPSEIRKFLFQKLIEEATEVSESKSDKELIDELIDELADVMEVIKAIQYHCGPTEDEIERARQTKFYKRGSFYLGVIWDGIK